MLIKCPYCEYVWQPKVANPRCCPRCKRYPSSTNEFTMIDDEQAKEYITRPVSIFRSNSPGGDGSYYLCYSCPTDSKQRAIFRIGDHNYCKDCAVKLIGEMDIVPQ